MKAPKNSDFHFDISAMAEADEFNIVMSLGFIISNHSKKVGVALGKGSSQKYWGPVWYFCTVA